jgi:hypothetical protein
MDCQKIFVYGLIILVSIYLLKDVCGVKLPFIEGFDNIIGENSGPVAANSVDGNASIVSGENGTGVVPNSPPVPNSNAGTLSDLAPPQQVIASEPYGNEVNLPVQGIESTEAPCYPQNRLSPQDLLPTEDAGKIEELNQQMQNSGEGYLAGVNFLDAGFNIGINTIGQSLRNANLNLRAEPPNPRTMVSPWLNSTIDIDLQRKSLGDGNCGPTGGDGLDA